ncbi:hypothetical protein AB1N83_012396 [Pleurotus pulmonarius]
MPLQLALFTHRRRFITGCASSCLSILLRSLTAVGSSLSQVDVRRPASPVCSVHSPPSVLLSHRKCVLPPLQTDPFTHCLAFSPLTALRVLPCLSSLFHSLTTVGSSLSQHAVRRAASPACSVHSPPSVPPSHSSECVVLPLQLAPLTHCRRFLPLTASASSCLLNLLRSLIAFHSPLSQQVVRRPTSYASSVHSSPSVLPSHSPKCVVLALQLAPFTHHRRFFPLTQEVCPPASPVCPVHSLSSILPSRSSQCVMPPLYPALLLTVFRCSLLESPSVVPSYSLLYVVQSLQLALLTPFFPLIARSVLSFLSILLRSLTFFGHSLAQQEVCLPTSITCSVHSLLLVPPSHRKKFLWCHHLGETMSIRNLSNFLTELKVRKVEYEDQPCEIEKRG